MKLRMLYALVFLSATVQAQSDLIVAATPVLTPKTGTYTTAQTVTITDATSDATIYYTTNGSTPTTASSKYTAAIKVSATETIEAIAVVKGDSNSAVASATYTIETPTATPVFSPAGGSYTAAQSVSMSDATKGASIFYTTNGSTPTSASTKYTTPISISDSTTVKAIAVAKDYTQSAVASATYTITAASAPPLAWVPFVLTPTYGTTGGKNGLILMSATNLAASPTPIYVTTQPVQSVAILQQFPIGSYPNAEGELNVLGAIQLYVYATAGADGKIHLYGLNLTDSTAVPVPTQLSTLSLPALTSYCGGAVIQTNLNDATSVGLLITIAGPNGCAGGNNSYQYVKYSDSPTTSPLPVSLPYYSAWITPTYNYDGTLSGLLAQTQASDTSVTNTYFYTGDSFINPKLLLSNTPFFFLSTVPPKSSTGAPSYVGSVYSSTTNESTLYVISAGGAVSTRAIPGEVLSSVFDDNNFYFSTATSLTGGIYSIYQIPLSFVGTPELLYGGTDIDFPQLVGSDDKDLVVQTDNEVFALPVGQTSTAPKVIAGPLTGDYILGASVVAASRTTAVGSNVFISELNFNLSTKSIVLGPSGVVRQPLENGATYDVAGNLYVTGGAPLGTFVPSVIIQVSGITDTGSFAGYGGGHFNVVNVATLASTSLITASGALYTIPTGDGYNGGLFALAPTLAAGSLDVLELYGASEIGLVADLTKHLIVPISIKNTDVSVFSN